MNKKEREVWGAEIVHLLRQEYPKARIALHFSTPLELLVATILSAQSTDKKINEITRDLFKKYRSVRDYAAADCREFEEDIRSSGFFRSKAKNIIAAAQTIQKEFGGKVPQTMGELLRLRGVARKTANIVLYNAFGVVAGIAVDTHVWRLAQRLGLSKNDNPDKIEEDLMEILPRQQWGPLNYLLIEHGRKVCQAKSPRCSECVLRENCPSASTFSPR